MATLKFVSNSFNICCTALIWLMGLVLFIAVYLENSPCFLVFCNTCHFPWVLDTVYRMVGSEVNQNQV